jgi:competence protein ComEC
VLAEMRRQAVSWHTLVRGDRLTGTGVARIDVLWPPPLDELAIEKTNDTGIVLRIEYAHRRVLLCADIEEFAQQHLLASADLKADVLVLPHHGGVESNTAAFIKAVDPTWCVRSSGQRDAHTHNGILDLVAGRKYFNTADDGAIEICMTPAALQVSSQRNR